MIPQYITVQNAHQYKTDEKVGERDFFDTLFTFPPPHEKNRNEAQRDQQKHLDNFASNARASALVPAGSAARATWASSCRLRPAHEPYSSGFIGRYGSRKM